MVRTSSKTLMVGLAVLFLSGCTVTTYTQVKDKVDQDMPGNAGYLQGTPPPEAKDRSAIRKTRKIYVVEMQTKGPKEQPVTQQAAPAKAVSSEVSRPAPAPSLAEEISRSLQSAPVAPAATPAAKQLTGPVEYKVEKGDTLQKISKKFYDTYGRWNKIYQANKDKISDPNRIKPGITITIPE
ncbi:MAG TPA: LysM peptidoglycan-binding domain-containing protein [Candidatus Omnitrophota bacterium]|nr:LysM peptidoglycan-binding domain-containing protein [Candidatus Omnitrophota bacterium]HPD83872.1 LysM peptidoglycan-binding domain-containing protein [Candidatus Omnitrophota bacterium]HRZ02729.1 LysM peptidoglycan-binding domain-containing protein [Candidatus Omnitrophota bacterium]